MNFTIRELTSHEDFEATVALQQDAWGKSFRDITPPILMVTNAKIGGFAAGAFDSEGTMHGFVFTMTGLINGESIQWSEKMAVNSALRGKGLGFRLKLFQREQLLERGYKHIYWTFDPLQVVNANLNINRLGVKTEEYVQDFYPVDEQNILQKGIGTDRFIVKWEINSPHVRERLEKRPTPSVNRPPKDEEIANTTLQNGIPKLVGKSFQNDETVFVEIPKNLNELFLKDMNQAISWRENTRLIFQHYFDEGYQVVEFANVETRCFYLLERRS